MAGQIIVAVIGLICIILSFFTGDGDALARYGLITFGVILIAFAGWSYYNEQRPRIRDGGRKSKKDQEHDKVMAAIEDIL